MVGGGSYQHLISSVSFVLVAVLLFYWQAVSGKSVMLLSSLAKEV